MLTIPGPVIRFPRGLKNKPRAPNRTGGGAHILAYAKSGGAPSTEGALVGSLEEISRQVGRAPSRWRRVPSSVACSAGSRQTLHRFATEIMPDFGRDPPQEREERLALV